MRHLFSKEVGDTRGREDACIATLDRLVCGVRIPKSAYSIFFEQELSLSLFGHQSSA